MKLLVLIASLALACAVCPTSTSYKTGGDYTITLSSGRTALLHVPRGYNGVSALPLVINFHGLGSTAQQQAAYTGFSTKADSKQFFVVYPQGLSNSWNAGSCCGDSGNNQVDDIAYIKALLDQLTKNLLCVNIAKIYATGFSNGGFMTYRMGCNETGYSLAAMAPVSGLNGNTPPHTFPCTLSRPLPLIHFHGTADPTVSYAYVNYTIQTWATKDGCQMQPQTTTFTKGAAVCYGLSCPNPASNNITVCLVNGGVHSWPGAFGGSQDISATDQIWNFFSRF